MRARSGTPAPARSRAANGPAVHSCRNLCRFSARTPSSRPSTSAEAADVARGTSRCPPARSAYSRARIAVVLPGPGGPDPGQQQPRVAGERGHQVPLPGVERTCRRRPRTRRARRPPTARTSPAAVGVLVALTSRASASRTAWLVYRPGAVLGEHRLPVGAAQFGRLVEQRGRLDRDRVLAGETASAVTASASSRCRSGGRNGTLGAEQALDLGPDVPHRPGGTAGGHSRHGPFGQILTVRRGRSARGRPQPRDRRGPPASACATAPAPNRAVSSSRHAARLSARERGGFLPCRVSRLACRASWWDALGVRVVPVLGSGSRAPGRRTGPRSRPAAGRRTRSSPSGTPVISRTGSRPPVVSGPGGEGDAERRRQARPRTRCCRPPTPRPSSGTAARASSARHFPSVPWTFDETATWVCRFGSPARESQCSNAAAISPFVSTWAIPPVPGPGERGVLLDQVQRLASCARLVRAADRVAHPGPLVQRPQQRGRLDRGEDQVEPGDGGPLPAGLLGLRPSSPRPRSARGRSPRGSPPAAPRPARRTSPAAGRRGTARPSRAAAIASSRTRLQLPVGHPGADVRRQVGGDDRLAVGVLAEPEQRPHLLLGDLPPGQAEQRRAPPGPPPRRVPLRGVVGRRVRRCRVGLGPSASPWAVCLVRYVYPSPAVIFAMVITMRAARFVPPRGARPEIASDAISAP